MRSHRKPILLRVLLIPVVLGLLCPPVFAQQSNDRRPNIVLIVTDDMGFADIGSFGGEIATPNIDALAYDGVRFTNFYTHASCSPTRSMLLSGVDTHLNGLGNMSEWIAPNQKGKPGYEGVLTAKAVYSLNRLTVCFNRWDFA
jgi:arylsulfatase